MDHQLASWMNAADESKDAAPSVRILDKASGKIELSGLASPFSVLRYVLAPLGELYGGGTGRATVDPLDEALSPLLQAIQKTILETFEEDPRLTDARVIRALTRLREFPEGDFAVFGLTASLQLAMRLTLSLNDYSRQDVIVALREIGERVALQTKLAGPQGYLHYIRQYMAK